MVGTLLVSGFEVDLLLIVTSLIILIGYISQIAFRITKIPEVLILISIGLLLGPVFHLLPSTYISALRGLSPLFGSLAIIMIIFNGGRRIRLTAESMSESKGYLLALVDIVLVSAVTALFMFFVFGWPLLFGALLGAILGETSAIVIIPIISRLRMPRKLYEIISIESTFNSVFSILAFYLLLLPISGKTLTLAYSLQYIFSYISIAVILGLVSGVVWLIMQNSFGRARNYLVTIAIAILLYGLTDLFNAAGVVSVLAFAIIIGNSKSINKRLGLKTSKSLQGNKSVELEMEFLLRTFFFVFLGVIAVISFYYFLFAVILTIIFIMARKLEIEGLLHKMARAEKDLAFSMMPRGLSAAVLSSILYATGYPYSAEIFYITFMALVLTNIAFGIYTRRSAGRVKILNY